MSYQQQRPPYGPPRRSAWTDADTAMAVIAVICAAVRVLGPLVTYDGITLSQAHQLCSSGLGTLAQAFSQQASLDCSRVSSIYDALNACLAAAVVLAVIVAVRVLRAR